MSEITEPAVESTQETTEKPVENLAENPTPSGVKPVSKPVEKPVVEKPAEPTSSIPTKPVSTTGDRTDKELDELRAIREEVTRMTIDAAIKEQGLPDEFAQLVPRDSITSARSFLASDGFKKIVSDYRQLQVEKAELAQKLEQATAKLEKPIPNENAKPVPTETTSPTEKLAPKKWGEFDDSFYQQLGATFKLF
ncbi:MAG: hypothetical protein QW683_08600 [Candidatus Caldarchaeum sp.]